MRTVITLTTTRSVGIHEVSGFLSGIAAEMPGCFIAHRPGGACQIVVNVLHHSPVSMEAAEAVLDRVPHLSDLVCGLSLG